MVVSMLRTIVLSLAIYTLLVTFTLYTRNGSDDSRRLLRENKDKHRNKPSKFRGNITQARLMHAKLGHIPTHRWQVATKRLDNITSSQLPGLYKVFLSQIYTFKIF
jgi:hypothetical protein